jgi:hypothetical protein
LLYTEPGRLINSVVNIVHQLRTAFQRLNGSGVRRLVLVAGFLLLILSYDLIAQSPYTSVASGNWNTDATWSGTGIPVAGDVVIISGGFTVTVTANAACGSINFATIDNNILAINSGFTLTVSGAITIPRANALHMNTLAVGAGNLNAGSIAFTDSRNTVRHRITISTGTVTVTGNVTRSGNAGISPSIIFTGAGRLNLGGTFFTSATGTLTTFAGSTVEYNANGAQVVADFNYHNLTVSGGNTKTLSGNTTVYENLTISNLTSFQMSIRNLTINGTTSISGTLLDNSPTGANRFDGLVTLNAGGSWDFTSGDSNCEFRGGLSHNGASFNSGTGTYFFTTNNQGLGGATAIIFDGPVIVTGIILSNTNNTTIKGLLSGTGIWSNSNGSVLNYENASAPTVTGFTVNTVSNTVNYSGSGPQNIRAATYKIT